MMREVCLDESHLKAKLSEQKAQIYEKEVNLLVMPYETECCFKEPVAYKCQYNRLAITKV